MEKSPIPARLGGSSHSQFRSASSVRPQSCRDAAATYPPWLLSRPWTTKGSIPQTHLCIVEVHSSALRWLENGEGRPLTDCRLPMCRWVGGGLSRITRCGPSLFFSSRQESSLLKLARRVFWLAVCDRWMDPSSPGNEIDRGLGKTRTQPSNHGLQRGDKTGTASLDWLPINKVFPTPCKQTALGSRRAPASGHPNPLLSDNCPSAHLSNPGASAAIQQFAPSHWTLSHSVAGRLRPPESRIPPCHAPQTTRGAALGSTPPNI